MFNVEESKAIVDRHIPQFPSTLLVLGSGWNEMLKEVESETEISYEELFGVKTSVPGHDGKLVVAEVDSKRVALMSGRFHTYEGYTSEEVTRPIQVFAQAGLEQVVITAAAGALNEKYEVGDFVILNDMLTAFCQSPLIGPKFTDLSHAFNPRMRAIAQKIAVENEIPIHEGKYVYVQGPHFETPADKMMYRQLGADVIGMSTVPETIMANHLGVAVLGIACVTNLAFVKHAHEDVLQASQDASENMVTLLRTLVERIA